MGECPRCRGTGWISFERPARDVSWIYRDRDYRLKFAKKCPECTKAKADSWEQDFRQQDEWQDLEDKQMTWEDVK